MIAFLREFVVLADFCQRLKNLPLLLCELGRNHHIHGHKLISAASLAQADDALVAQAEDGSALGAFGNFELLFAFEGWDGDF